MTRFSGELIGALRSVLGEGAKSLHEPRFIGNESQYVLDCVNSSYVSSVGNYVERFEEALVAYTGAARAVAVVNGTSALQVALQVSDVQENDEVIVPSLTFIATANAVRYLGAIPHFSDISDSTLGLDPIALRDWLKVVAEPAGDHYRNKHSGRRIRAIVPMHTFGHPCEIEDLLSVAHDYRMVVTEDASESLGSFYKGQHTGTFGLLGALSFNGNKIITTGGGGAILTNDEKLADYAKYLTTTAKKPHMWEYIHDEIGYNFRMPNLNAALGCAQMEQLPSFLASKRHLFNRYKEALSEFDDVRLMQEPKDCSSNYWLQALILQGPTANERDEVLQATNDAGLMTRPAWRLLHQLPPYKGCPRSPLPVAEELAARIINIPSSAGLV